MRTAEGNKGSYVETTYPDYIQAADIRGEAEFAVGRAIEGSFRLDPGAADDGHHFFQDAALWQSQYQILVCLNVEHGGHTSRQRVAGIHRGFFSGSLALVFESRPLSVFQAVDLRPTERELLFKPLVATIQMIDAVDYGLPPRR